MKTAMTRSRFPLAALVAAVAALGAASTVFADGDRGHGHGKHDRDHLALLLEAVGAATPDWQRQAAVEFVDAAGAAEMKPVMRATLPAFGDARPVVRYYAIVGLGASALASLDNAEDLEKAVPALSAALADDEPIVREAAAAVIAAVQPAPPSWVAWPLTLALEDPDPRVVSAALAALARVESAGEAEEEAVSDDLYHHDEKRRSRAVRALGAVAGDRESGRDTLIWALSDPDPLVRRNAAATLGTIGPRAAEANAALSAMANDNGEEPAVREAARMALRNVLD